MFSWSLIDGVVPVPGLLLIAVFIKGSALGWDGGSCPLTVLFSSKRVGQTT